MTDESKPYMEKAYDAYTKSDFETAAKYYLYYLQSNPDDATSWYNLSCCYGLLNKPELAAKYLKVAYKAGFTDTNHIAQDTDFTIVRNDAVFQNAVDSLKTWNERKEYYMGKMEYFPSSSYIPYWIHLPKTFNPANSYTLVIGLHGYGDKAYAFTNLWKQMESENIIFVVPEAPYPFIEGNNAGFSWMPFVGHEDKLYEKSFVKLNDFIKDLTKNIQSNYKINQTWLFGFSQGAYYSYLLGLKNPKLFTGIVVNGGGLVTDNISAKDFKAAKYLKILISHGKQDKVVPFTEGQQAYDLLKSKGFYHVTLQDFEGGHTISPEAIKTMKHMIIEPDIIYNEK
jgi:phospholipase/carboxylesterase